MAEERKKTEERQDRERMHELEKLKIIIGLSGRPDKPIRSRIPEYKAAWRVYVRDASISDISTSCSFVSISWASCVFTVGLVKNTFFTQCARYPFLSTQIRLWMNRLCHSVTDFLASLQLILNEVHRKFFSFFSSVGLSKFLFCFFCLLLFFFISFANDWK